MYLARASGTLFHTASFTMMRDGILFASGILVGLLPALLVLANLQIRVREVEVPRRGSVQREPDLQELVPNMQNKVEDQGSVAIQVFEPAPLDQGLMTQCSNQKQTWNALLLANSTYCANVRLPGTDPDCFLVHSLVSGLDSPYRICDHSGAFRDETFLLGIGPPKTSSTVLYNSMTKFLRLRRAHNPNRCCGMEYHFWSQDSKFTAGLEAYKRTYWHPTGPGVFFEKTPEYFYNPLVAYRVVQLVPHAKLIITLRSPLAAAQSLYRHGKKLCPHHGIGNFTSYVDHYWAAWQTYSACRERELHRIISCKYPEHVSVVDQSGSSADSFLQEAFFSLPRHVKQSSEEHVISVCGPLAPFDLNAPYGSMQWVPQYRYTEALLRWSSLHPRSQLFVAFQENLVVHETCVNTTKNLRAHLQLDSHSYSNDTESACATFKEGKHGPHAKSEATDKLKTIILATGLAFGILTYFSLIDSILTLHTP